ncbi:hypothetical protein HNR42_003147 [Deinobacterium chartae]|uniref:Uncharacterized protein n=1 Tax=Deinobacterium chartae TaxID=521158 RepID=A0A841I5Z7_9DEIO|nr:hypothetical protein [Deinobacterium chartae]MBB6099689.1 hypothetical protein [Deinobacterium chartae]
MRLKAPLILLLCAALTACGAGTPAPTGTSPGTNPGGAAYNPNANPRPSGDSRVPYRGDWVWAVSFSSGESFVGAMSISRRAPADANFVNVGVGVSEWCVSSDCRFSGDVGMIGTMVFDDGSYHLTAAHYDASSEQVRFMGLDHDGRVGNEVEGRPTLSGPGVWQFTSGGTAQVGFAMVQVDADPAVKLQGTSKPTPALPRVGEVLRVQGKVTGHLEVRALEVLRERLR